MESPAFVTEKARRAHGMGPLKRALFLGERSISNILGNGVREGERREFFRSSAEMAHPQQEKNLARYDAGPLILKEHPAAPKRDLTMKVLFSPDRVVGLVFSLVSTLALLFSYAIFKGDNVLWLPIDPSALFASLGIVSVFWAVIAVVFAFALWNFLKKGL